ncbi:MAG: GAF domain-containing protein [Anaerolineae bacterium]|nr:MAG: GAF domain-containing protein [Anaerolineae bacterium]
MDISLDPTLQRQLFQDLLEINEAMALGAGDVLRLIWRKGARLIGAEHGSVRLLRSVGGRPVLALEAHFGEAWTGEKKRRLMELGESISGAVAQSGRSLCCADVTRTADYKGSFPELKSKICVPIRIGDQIIGVMNFNSRARGAFDDGHVRIVEAFAHQTALAVNNVRLNRREETTRRSLELSRAINRAINATLDLDEVMNTLLSKLDELGKATAVDVFVYDPAEQVLRNTYRLKRDNLGSLELGPDQGLIGATARSRQAINTCDVSQDPRYLQARESTRSELTMPLVQCDELIGVINLESDQLDTFDEDDEQFLEAVALAACIAIRNAREHERLQRAQEELKLASRRIIAMEDSDRFALTTYLHDEVQKAVSRLLIQARERGNVEVVALAQELERKVGQMRFDLSMPILPRNLRLELRQLVEEDLPQRYPAAHGLRHRLRLSALDEVRASDPSVGVLVYRFVRGAVANVYEHADAEQVTIEAEHPKDALLLRVADDGKGLDPTHIERFIQQGHFFFHDIRIRATQLGGMFRIESKPGKGTTLELRVPLF